MKFQMPQNIKRRSEKCRFPYLAEGILLGVRYRMNFVPFSITLVGSIALLMFSPLFAQNTLGLITNDDSKTDKGYNLVYPSNQPNVYLLNECGEIIHMWVDDSDFRPGHSAYLSEEGILYKTKRPSSVANSIITGGGAGGIIETRDWDNNLLWSTTIMDSLKRAHHDIAPMPNGNVLIISWEVKTLGDMVQAGRDTSLFSERELWPDFIIEINPDLDRIVWEWHAWDHLIQDHDSTKANFGQVIEHPELIDLNYDIAPFGGRPDWLHFNAIDYNEDLDQILISTPFFNEVWIIDHSTTTEEAKGHRGGNGGKGGDILYRWGNIKTYRQGTSADQKLFFQHDAHWNDDFIDPLNPDYGSIALFNNRVGANFSTVNVLKPQFDQSSNSYLKLQNTYLPSNFEQVIFHPDTFSFFSSGLSGVQFLNNNNALVTVGRRGTIYELTPENEIVWKYIIPLQDGVSASQGDLLLLNINPIFRSIRYPLDYEAFVGKNLLPNGFIEENPNTEFCESIITPTDDPEIFHPIEVFPNPSNGHFIVKTELDDQKAFSVSLVSMNGNILAKKIVHSTHSSVFTESLAKGIFFVRVDDVNGRLIYSQKIVIH